MNNSEINDIAQGARDAAGEFMRTELLERWRDDAFPIAVQAAGCTMLSALIASTFKNGEEPSRAKELLDSIAAEINRELTHLGYTEAVLMTYP